MKWQSICIGKETLWRTTYIEMSDLRTFYVAFMLLCGVIGQ